MSPLFIFNVFKFSRFIIGRPASRILECKSCSSHYRRYEHVSGDFEILIGIFVISERALLFAYQSALSDIFLLLFLVFNNFSSSDGISITAVIRVFWIPSSYIS